MKIERITVCNIASLAGTHSVDFTKDPLRTAGLFSISGATGAGKSTLLDALCLALFDQTPRLNQVGRLADLTNGEKQNDTRMLLRRNTAYGFAEVAFVGVFAVKYMSVVYQNVRLGELSLMVQRSPRDSTTKASKARKFVSGLGLHI